MGGLLGARLGRRQPPRLFTVVLPDGPEGTFSVLAHAFDDPSQEQTVHIDRYGGQVVSTYGYQQYSALAKTVSHGIALHEGRHLRLVNMALSAAMCLGVLFLWALTTRECEGYSVTFSWPIRSRAGLTSSGRVSGIEA